MRGVDFSYPADYSALVCCINELCEAYSFVWRGCIGKSTCGRELPYLRLGEGDKRILYIGCHHAMEWITSWILLRYLYDLAEAYVSCRTCFGAEPEYLLKTRSIYVIPMLNPDGTELQQHGEDSENPMRERLISMNGGSEDFSRWQANARGVDLNHNYNSGFDEYKKLEAEAGILDGAPGKYSGAFPESEPESSALCAFIRAMGDVRLLLTFHTQGQEIFGDCRGYYPPHGYAIGRQLARYCGYRLCRPTGGAAYGGLKDWYIEEFDSPAYTIECGRGENPLPIDNGILIYAELCRMLFRAPLLV